MTEPRDDFERRLEAKVRSYLSAGSPQLDPRRAAERAMEADAARPTSLAAILGSVGIVLLVGTVGLVIVLGRVPLPPVGASPSPSGPPPASPSGQPLTPGASPFEPTSWSLVTVPTPPGHPDFVVFAATPDGSSVYFRDAETYDRVFLEQGGKVTEIALPFGGPITLRLAPDGSFAVLEQFPGLWRYDAGSGSLTPLPDLPDGTSIQWFDFARADLLGVLAGRTDTPIHPTQLWTLDLNSESWSKVGTRSDAEMVFGTDRGLVVFVDASVNDDQSGWSLHLVASDGTDSPLYDATGAVASVAVSPDGRFLAYSSAENGAASYVVDLTGAGSTTISDGGSVQTFAPDSSQFSVAFSDGHVEAFDINGNRTASLASASQSAWLGHSTARPSATPLIVDGWAIPTPYPLPEGAVRLPLDSLPAPEHLNLPSGATFAGCLLKHIEVTIAYDPTGSPVLSFNGGVGPLWPFGVSARLYNGRAEIVGPDGAVLGRDGDTVAFAGGLYGDTGRDLICVPSTFPVPAGTDK